ncbi:hypothetical protein PE067_13230 [Paracoccus sp. DMF-8]|uniref:hypothetical protein n=1 Tax=Paracoccus sp. DMF-8 TaxID=3019445 RepID=UPI0023E849BD|nr:hypothetical protein [Paracoccus sp. DMF-8]MDF3607009.1 hypothetical protein [Paracoccus sp. DMF-8]
MSLTALLLGAVAAQAEPVMGCRDAFARGFDPDAIVEPWQDNSATYANGEIRIAKLDMIEPAGTPYRLLVLMGPRDEVGGRRCVIVQDSDGDGFARLDFAGRTSAYDPVTGLTLTFPVETAIGGDQTTLHVISIELNSQTGDVSSDKKPAER